MNNRLIDPNLAHAKASKVGILLVNLGTPAAPTAQAFSGSPAGHLA